jgi:hypothetical protein
MTLWIMLVVGVILGSFGALGWRSAAYWKGRQAETAKVLAFKEQTIDSLRWVIDLHLRQRRHLAARALKAEHELADSRRALVVRVSREAGVPWDEIA